MKRVLLTIGAVVQILVLALHVAMFFGLSRTTEVPDSVKGSLYIFNAAVATAVAFFAYVSLFRRRELMETPLGRVICGFVALFYLQRGVVGTLVRGFDPVDIVVFSAIAFLYVFVAAPRRPRQAEGAAPMPACG